MQHTAVVTFIWTHQWFLLLVVTDMQSTTRSQIIESISKMRSNTPFVFKSLYENITTSTSTPPSFKTSFKFLNKATPKKKLKATADIPSIIANNDYTDWRCPNITGSRSLECGCDLPHTLRCNGDIHGLSVSI